MSETMQLTTVYFSIGIVWGFVYHSILCKKIDRYNSNIWNQMDGKRVYFTKLHFVIVLSIMVAYPLWMVYWFIDGIVNQF